MEKVHPIRYVPAWHRNAAIFAGCVLALILAAGAFVAADSKNKAEVTYARQVNLQLSDSLSNYRSRLYTMQKYSEELQGRLERCEGALDNVVRAVRQYREE